MPRQPQRIVFHTFADVASHLDRWASSALTGAEAWEAALLDAQSWLDYSARNQVLLASYGADGPVAGPETWRFVPSTHDGRSCAVRAGEHGYPVRVPVTTGGTEPDPYLGGIRPTRAAVERFEWRPVFEIGQLARRPAPGALTPIDVPPALTGPDATDAFLTAVRKLAAATVRGRLAKSDDAQGVLADAAVRLRRSSKHPELIPVLRDQVAWLVAERVGLAPGDRPPEFDPSRLKPRERWERLQDVLEPARKLTAALGVVVGVDLVSSPLPRMEVVDDRVVPAGRRHRLPAASLEQLPVGRWVSVGPYSAQEWMARGEDASGRGAYLRLNKSAYLVAVEHGDTAGWRLEDTASRTGHGILATGESRSLDDACADAVAVVRERYPALASTPDTAAPSPRGVAEEWQPMPGDGGSAAELRHLDEQITLYVIPGPGGRWMPAVHNAAAGGMEKLPYTRTVDEARDAAELAGRRAARALAISDPAALDGIVVSLARSDDYSRRELGAIVGGRLTPDDRARLATADAAELVELLGEVGITPAGTVAVLRAEQVDRDAVAALLPVVGVPIPDSIRVLHEVWEMPRHDAAAALHATATEMRDAGCTAAEIMATRPREILRTLPEDPHLWELAAGTMAVAGHHSDVIAGHLVAHAPSVEAFAAGLTVGIGDARTGLTLATRYGATGDQLAAASEAYGLSPRETAAALADAGTFTNVLLDALVIRCDDDIDAAVATAAGAGVDRRHIAAWREPSQAPSVAPGAGAGSEMAALLAALPPPRAALEDDPIGLLESLVSTEPLGLQGVQR